MKKYYQNRFFRSKFERIMPADLMELRIKEHVSKNEEPFELNYDRFDEKRLPKFYMTYEVNKYLEQKASLDNSEDGRATPAELLSSSVIRADSFTKEDNPVPAQTNLLGVDGKKRFGARTFTVKHFRQFSRCRVM